jgi:acetyl esterase/lipase
MLSLLMNFKKENALRILTLTLLLLLTIINSFAQQTVPLYPGKIPNSIKVPNIEKEDANHFLVNVSQPTLTIYLPPASTANGTSVIVCPEGGYSALNIIQEGSAIAENLNKLGVAAFVLKYRLPDDKAMPDKSIGPIQDAQQAIMLVRQRAKEWNIDTAKVGIMGFSAGGHLASTAGTHFTKSYIDNPRKINLRPDFMILVYPVISFADSIGHIGSRDNLIGKNPSAQQIALYSNELQITHETTPTFLIQAGDDGLVNVKNSIVFYLALQKNNVPAGLHIFPKGQHGFPYEPAHSTWFQYCAQWLRENGWFKP